MGSHHTASILTSDSSNLNSDPATFTASEWSGLEVAEVNFNVELRRQGYATISPSSSSCDPSTISNTTERIKRKIDSIDSSSSSFESEKDLRPTAYTLETQRSDNSSPSFTTVSTSIIKEQTALSSSNHREIDCVECDNSSWDRSVDEEDRGQKDEYISLRRRRRLNLIVPNPRKPRTADYMCSLCTEMYQVVVGDNPWWAVYSQQCPQCKQQQVPRIDINSASNAIELDPNVMALYGEGVEDSGDDECEGGSEEEEDAEKDYDEEAVAAAAEADQDDLRNDVHPFDGEGLLAVEEASKLLVLMCHARSCTGVHASPKHAEICKSTKYLMLHIRDCSGTDVHSRDCQFPWCLPCKKMLKHLTHCYEPASCLVCNPWTLPESFRQLHRLNSNNNVSNTATKNAHTHAQAQSRQQCTTSP